MSPTRHQKSTPIVFQAQSVCVCCCARQNKDWLCLLQHLCAATLGTSPLQAKQLHELTNVCVI